MHGVHGGVSDLVIQGITLGVPGPVLQLPVGSDFPGHLGDEPYLLFPGHASLYAVIGEPGHAVIGEPGHAVIGEPEHTERRVL
ncbi:hypothetical protein FKM82_002730 [Ascaphus truei]